MQSLPKRCLIVVVFGFLLSINVHGQEVRDTLSVFFVGNSYVYYNNLPAILEEVAESLDGPVIETGYHYHFRGLQNLVEARTLPAAFEHNDSGRSMWDVVLIQENSRLGSDMDPLTGALGKHDGFHEAVRELDEVVRDHGALPVLYMTWAKKQWPDQISVISRAYQEIGRQVGAPVAVVGLAWVEALRERPELELFTPDGSHPTPAGSYLTACVIYSTLTQRSPMGATGEASGNPWNGSGPIDSDVPTKLVSLSKDDASFLQRVAWEVVGSHN